MALSAYAFRRPLAVALGICLLSWSALLIHPANARVSRTLSRRESRLPAARTTSRSATSNSVALQSATNFVAPSNQGAVRPQQQRPEPGGKIVFSSQRDGNYEIYVMNPDGGGVRRLTSNPLSDVQPAWSPDGNRIAFVSDRDGNAEIYVTALSGDANGFNLPNRLTNNPAADLSPAWSPDGTKIAFVSNRSGGDEIFVMNADGTNQVDLSNNPFDDYDPAWSPDGSKLAFVSNRDGNPQIFVMDASGANQLNVSNNAFDDSHPSWGGTRIAFQSTRDGNEEIYSMNADGSAQTRLTNNPASDTEPSIGADGAFITFTSERDGNREVYLMRADGSAQTRLTRNTEDNDFQPMLQRQAVTLPLPAASTVQFSSATYSVAENAGSTQITVTRTGDTSGASAVDYAATSGTATERSDFTTAIGTLRFGNGETSKTITIFINDDALAEENETVNLTLSNPTGATLGLPASATLTIIDNDAVPSLTNPVDSFDFFVRQQYIDFLNREPEAAGLNAWLNVLRNCRSGDASCDRITVSADFFLSPEFQIKGYFVIRFYLVAFNRLPTYLEFVRDIQRINGQASDEVIANQTAFTNEFADRLDFLAIYNSLNNAAYVDRLLQNAGVTISNRDQLVGDLDAGRQTRAQVLRGIVENQQLFQAQFNRGFVAAQYYGYLRRDPDTAGFNAWLNYLNTHPGDFRTMVNGFLNSVEYRTRFGPS